MIFIHKRKLCIEFVSYGDSMGAVLGGGQDNVGFTDIQVDFVTNLKEFYLNTDIWSEIFRRNNIRVCTSFNYGNTRMWDKDTVYDEVMFRKVMNLFGERIGWLPMFISVIDYDNEWSINKTIELAKNLGTQCRLNNAMKLGRQGVYYPRAKMIWTIPRQKRWRLK